MTATKTAAAPAKAPLIQLLNGMLVDSSSKLFLIEGIDEEELAWFKVTIDMDKDRKIAKENLDDLEFCKMLWSAGMLLSKNHDELKSKITNFLGTAGNCPKALAIDTNLIYSRFLQTFLGTVYSKPYEKVPFITVVGRGSNDEMHYKTSSNYRSMWKADFEAFCKLISQDPNVGLLLTNRNKPDEVASRMKQASSRQGRLGLKGLLYFRELQAKYQMICSRPLHLYYAKEMSSKMLDGKSGVQYPDAVYDAIIRHEVEFIRDNTNVDVLFLTADKNSDEASETEGLLHQYVQQPTRWADVNAAGVSIINVDHVEKLLLEFLAFSPFVKISCDGKANNAIYLAYTWIGKLPADNLEGRIQAWDGKDVNYYYMRF